MLTEQNAAVARRWFTEGWTGNMHIADEIFAADFTTNGQRVGPAGPKRNVANRLAGFPDLQSTLEDQVAVDDRVVTRVLWSGTHTGPYSGIQPTGIRVEQRGIIMWRFADGHVVEDWTVADQFGLLQQVGLVPAGVIGVQVPESETHAAG
ncbi:MAG: ester cyclase [Chloroflexi bacterium]|nr:ester cyclase [Chloroflexota bacterium]